MGRFASVFVLALGCGGKHFAHEPADAGADAGVDAGSGPAAAAALPAAPELVPCPKGWREVADPEDATLVTCDPWPEGGAQDCGADEAHFPGEPGCRRIGTACPAGDYAEDIPAEATVVYVKAGAPAGGDGTFASPFARIADALAAEPDGTVIALSKGTFDEAVTVGQSHTLWGACVAETILASSSASVLLATLTFRSRAGATAKNLQVSGARRGVIATGSGATGNLDSVLIRAATDHGLFADAGAVLAAQDVVIRDTIAVTFGRAIEIQSGASVDLVRAVLERNRSAGVAVFGPSSFTATDLAITDTESRLRDRGEGFGLELGSGAYGEITRAAIERNRSLGFGVFDAGAELVATDVVIRDTRVRESDEESGYAINLNGGAHATLLRASFDRNVATAILAAGVGTELDATDLVIRDTVSRPTDRGVGTAVQAKEGARIDLERGVFARNRTAGFFCDDAGTVLAATDVVVRDTAEQERDGQGGHGVLLRTGSRLELSRALFERNRSAGLLIVDPETTLVASDLTIRETRSRFVDGGAGDGLQFYGGAQVEIVRAALTRNRRNGIIAYEDVTFGSFEDLVVEDTLEQECVPDCPGFVSGIVAAEGGDRLDVRRFRVSGSTNCGVQLALGGTMDLHEGVVSHNHIGANVQTPGFDIGRLQDDVRYEANVVDLDGSSIPVPGPVDAVTP